ncbi:LOW QUALITY PROTEIN: secernin-2 [Macrosteles quadrilineatus]|uniref:LOW QUALITY PROTEIN: secernin-2 n=1 Tax=Macrosteles quadrilineatus TaxID=74068 RepID=UPI0023E311D9|nr:LOW QUALITY PROTEIN: secernin-2 [Macrosteles quadrilineatus]
MNLYGCDTFVVLPPLTKHGDIIFGKNSDRPYGEVQEVVYYPHKKCQSGSKLQCTYIEIDQNYRTTNAVLLSKPSWMWGAEMGSNNHGVVIGNEAVWTEVDDNMKTERLLGMDLLRLGLERATTGSEAVGVITELLEQYGQGGPCSDTDTQLLYHNSFLIADKKEAWVLETAGKLWAAEKIKSGPKNISNCLSIGTNISAMSKDLLKYVKEEKLWSGEGEFDFKSVLSSQGCNREEAGRNILRNLSSDKQFDTEKMFQVLRNKDSGICRPADDPFHTSGSWVSVLSSSESKKPSCHWVTATPDPSVSVFKPFVFTSKPTIPPEIISPAFTQDPAKAKPRFQFKVDRQHQLYKLHKKAYYDETTVKILKEVEKTLVGNTSALLQAVEENKIDQEHCNELLKTAVEAEIKVYG